MPKLTAEYDCVCGGQHESIGRLGGFPILLCPAAPSHALYFHAGKPFLTTGKVPPTKKAT